MTAHIDNRTPFASELFAFPDADGQEIAVLVISASFEINGRGVAEPLALQIPVRVTDEFYGSPECSSLRAEADVAIQKPLVDVIVIGEAHAPYGQPTRSLEVELHIANIHKRLLVRGDRKRLIRGIASNPQPFVKMPIIYERAYGGTHRSSSNPNLQNVYRWNPVGIGFKSALSADLTVKSDFPNIQYLDSPPKHLRESPAGFGAIGRGWSPRCELSGTYDEHWLKNQWPLPPHNLDPRYNQSAPQDQQSHEIFGGEDVKLVHLTAESEWCFRLPKLTFPVRLYFGRQSHEVVPKLDSVLIDVDVRRVTLSYRLAIPIKRNRPLREVVLGYVTAGWLRARKNQKVYRSLNGSNGTDLHRKTYK